MLYPNNWSFRKFIYILIFVSTIIIINIQYILIIKKASEYTCIYINRVYTYPSCLIHLTDLIIIQRSVIMPIPLWDVYDPLLFQFFFKSKIVKKKMIFKLILRTVHSYMYLDMYINGLLLSIRNSKGCPKNISWTLRLIWHCI